MSYLEAGLITAGAGDSVETAGTFRQVTDVLPPSEDAGLDSSEAEEG